MTIHRTLNQAGLGGNYTTWWLIKTLEAAGWVIGSSGSGTGGIFSGVGDVFDPAINPVVNSAITSIGVGIGSENWGNARCWVVLTAPDGSQLAIQRDDTNADSYDDEWAYQYSPAGTYQHTSGLANTVPPSIDAIDIHGTVNSSWPSIHENGGTANLIQIAADDALSPAGFSGFIMLEMIASNQIESMLMMDDFRNVPSGQFAAHAKTIYINDGPDSCDWAQLTSLTVGPKTIIDYGGGSEAWECAPCHRIVDGVAHNLYPNAGGAPASGEVPFPVPIGRYDHGGFGGLSRWLKWAAVSRGYNERSVSELLWYFGDVVIQDLSDGVTIPASIP